MAVDQDGNPKALARRLQQLGQGKMERTVEPLDAFEGGSE